MLLKYFLKDFGMFPVAPIITGITCVCCRCRCFVVVVVAAVVVVVLNKM
jgi:hypothetical protein